MVKAAEIRAAAGELGFNQVGIIPAAPSPRLDAYQRWVEAGMYGEMGYLARADRMVRRQDLNVIVPGGQSIIVVGLDYGTFAVPDGVLMDARRGRISNYAWGVDYHDVMIPRLEQLAARIGDTAARVYVDTGAVLERSHAQQAGLGFVGKNTMLIHPWRGSFMFLGEILTTARFDEYDSPQRESMCGTCTRCLTACPTKAFAQPYVLDAQRCISYLTIELKGSIPEDLRPLMGNWVYGCDICQTVCPWTRFVQPTAEAGFWPGEVDRAAPLLTDLLTLDDIRFSQRFVDAAIIRIKRDRLVRNACVAAGNSGLAAFGPPLEALAADDRSEMVREHARWAVSVLGG